MNPDIYPGIGSLQVRLQIEAQAKAGKRPKAPITMDEGELREIKRFYQQTFQDNFDAGCGNCTAKAFNRLLGWFPKLQEYDKQ